MMYLSDINIIHNSWNQFGGEYAVSDIFLSKFFSWGQQLKLRNYPRDKILNLTKKKLGRQNTLEKKLWTQEILAKKNLGPTKYPKENILDPQNNHEKIFWTNEIHTKKYFGPTKYSGKIFWTHEIPTKKYFRPAKYSQKIF